MRLFTTWQQGTLYNSPALDCQNDPSLALSAGDASFMSDFVYPHARDRPALKLGKKRGA